LKYCIVSLVWYHNIYLTVSNPKQELKIDFENHWRF